VITKTVAPELLADPTAVFATNGPDGRPQLTAVWFVVEDDRICRTTTSRSAERRWTDVGG
jgi:hypothetical protein